MKIAVIGLGKAGLPLAAVIADGGFRSVGKILKKGDIVVLETTVPPMTTATLANELLKIADELGIDFYESRAYANHDYCDIHLPSTGVGGHCIPVYPWFLIKAMEEREKFDRSNLLRTSRTLNDQMIYYWAEKILLACMKLNKPLSDVKICINGITFRDGVKELYHSRNLALTRLLMEKGLNVGVYDELFTGEEIENMGLKSCEVEEADLVFNTFSLELTTKEVT
ncbi:MAG: hypothetical protein OCU18_04955 [Candidatus Syntrophoarchaeum sp.]|nr:hypothetical protein [Candidatus Syntrophoarchaeum sp.]